MERPTNSFGETFIERDLDISGLQMLGCNFVKCRLVLNQKGDLSESIFDHCTFVDPGKWRDFYPEWKFWRDLPAHSSTLPRA